MLRMPRLVCVLGGFVLLFVGAGCGNGQSSAPASSSSESSSHTSASVDDATVIPFDVEGRLAILAESSADTIVTVEIEIAETDSARTRGMMQRESFPDETSGMLFPFDEEAQRYFHMANTPVALDILFIDADSAIVNIAKYARPFSSDLVESEVPAQYVLETPAGFSDTYGIVAGDRVRWERTDTSPSR